MTEAKASTSATALLPVCVLAGGLGTRLGETSRTLPKALVPVAGEPFVFHQLRLLSQNGAARIVLCVGHLGELIERAVGGTRFGLEIVYSYDSPSLDGTLGAIRHAGPLLGDRFLVLYGDTYLPIDYREAQRRWLASGLPAMMTVLHNDKAWGTSNAIYQEGRVVAHDKWNPTADMSWIDYGLGGLSASAVDVLAATEHDLSSLYRVLAERGDLFGYEALERFHDIGTPEALADTDAYLTSLQSH
jgi:NDP-sugar pyrophosphorylase family protein